LKGSAFLDLSCIVTLCLIAWLLCGIRHRARVLSPEEKCRAQSTLRSCRARFFVCFVGSGNSALVHGNSWAQ